MSCYADRRGGINVAAATGAVVRIIDIPAVRNCTRPAKGRRQKAEGKRQKAKGGRTRTALLRTGSRSSLVSNQLPLVCRQPGVQLRDHGGAFADRRRDLLVGAGAGIAYRKKPRYARLQRQRPAIARGPRAAPVLVGRHGRTRHDEALVIHPYAAVRQPAGVRICSDEKKHAPDRLRDFGSAPAIAPT